MSRYFKVPAEFPALHLQVFTQVYEFAGETNNVTLSTPQTDNPNIKTILVKGSIQLSYPDTDTPTQIVRATGRVWPTDEAIGKTKVSSVMLENDVEVMCVQPYDTYKITYNTHYLAPGESVTVQAGVLVFVFGTDYTVNAGAHSSFQIFALQNSDATIAATSDTKVVVFKAIQK